MKLAQIAIRLAGVAVIATLVSVPAVAQTASKAVSTPHGAPVVIQNNFSDPVPVNGNVVVSGTANVNVTNPVTVANTVAAPIPVLVTNASSGVSVTQPVLEVANGYCYESADPYGFGFVRCPLYTVPAGKRLVVEQVSFKITHLSNDPVDELMFGYDNAVGTQSVNFLQSAQTVFINHPTSRTFGSGATATETAYGTQAIHLVLEAGQTFSGQYQHSGTSPHYLQVLSFQGHLMTP